MFYIDLCREKENLRCRLDEVRSEVISLQSQLVDVSSDRDSLKKQVDLASAGQSPSLTAAKCAQDDATTQEDSSQQVETLRSQVIIVPSMLRTLISSLNKSY